MLNVNGLDRAQSAGRRAGMAMLIAALVSGAALAQPAPQDAAAAGLAREIAEAPARYMKDGAAPDSKGSGAYPAMKHQVAGLPNHVLYQPADLAALGKRKMPIYIFGNGACSEDAASSRQHLLEVASHGYLAISPGGIYSGPGVKMTPEGMAKHNSKTTHPQLGEAIDWAIAENKRRGSPFFGRLDTAHVAVSGYSCGGIQALKYAGDPRVTTLVIMNSGILDAKVPQMGEMKADKSLLGRINVPTLYVLGGPSDIAYPNGMDDFAQLKAVPSAVINVDVGHKGTYGEPNGGAAAQAVVAWLDWQLRGDKAASAWFVGKDCKLCTDTRWTIDRHNL